MWKLSNALDLPVPTALLAAWMVPPAAVEVVGTVPAPPEPAVIMFAGLCLLGAASALRGAGSAGDNQL